MISLWHAGVSFAGCLIFRWLFGVLERYVKKEVRIRTDIRARKTRNLIKRTKYHDKRNRFLGMQAGYDPMNVHGESDEEDGGSEGTAASLANLDDLGGVDGDDPTAFEDFSDLDDEHSQLGPGGGVYEMQPLVSQLPLRGSAPPLPMQLSSEASPESSIQSGMSSAASLGRVRSFVLKSR